MFYYYSIKAVSSKAPFTPKKECPNRVATPPSPPAPLHSHPILCGPEPIKSCHFCLRVDSGDLNQCLGIYLDGRMGRGVEREREGVKSITWGKGRRRAIEGTG